MVKAWDGITERRKYYRRSTDGYCAVHFDKIEHDNERHADLKKKDASICENVGKAKDELKMEVDKLEKVDLSLSTKIDEMNKIVVGKFWFRVVIGAMFASLIYIASQNRLSNNDQIEALRTIVKDQKEVVVVVNNIENKQIEMSWQMKTFESEIKDLNNRQNILRDAHMKLMDNQKNVRP
jgi:predicted  nucleic acid-binding Zn-ribbon protein